ncbi:hypothetical protein BDV93DRAFT_51918 [Ceratobasidium sp. AG-I]|nr:hypothetical protein BDV93DRAFT_51918 [Ceratobasidium sp. AG-I]
MTLSSRLSLPISNGMGVVLLGSVLGTGLTCECLIHDSRSDQRSTGREKGSIVLALHILASTLPKLSIGYCLYHQTPVPPDIARPGVQRFLLARSQRTITGFKLYFPSLSSVRQ